MESRTATVVDFVAVKASFSTRFHNTQEFADIVPSVFTPVLAKHSKSFNLIDMLSVGVDRIQRNFEPQQRQVETWRKTQITDDTAKVIFYSAFIDGKPEAPRTLCCPKCIGCISSRSSRNSPPGRCGASRTRLPAPSNKLDPVPQFKALASPIPISSITRLNVPSGSFSTQHAGLRWGCRDTVAGMLWMKEELSAFFQAKGYKSHRPDHETV